MLIAPTFLGIFYSCLKYNIQCCTGQAYALCTNITIVIVLYDPIMNLRSPMEDDHETPAEVKHHADPRKPSRKASRGSGTGRKAGGHPRDQWGRLPPTAKSLAGPPRGRPTTPSASLHGHLAKIPQLLPPPFIPRRRRIILPPGRSTFYAPSAFHFISNI
jgi:hypothetical protein